MSAKTKSFGKRAVVPVFSSIDEELAPTTPARARKLITAGVAKRFDPYEDGTFAIKLTTETRKEAYSVAQQQEILKAKCWGCGKDVKTSSLRKRSWCPECLDAYETERGEDLKAYLMLRAKMMLDRAIRILEHQNGPIWDYREAVDVVAERIEKDPTAFDSSHEIAAVLELLRNRVHVKLHPTVGKYKPDMVLPEEKVVLEIDGWLHAYKKKQDKQRDIDLRMELGADWEIVRIPTKYIEKNVRQLLKAIRELRKQMQLTRQSYAGILPAEFSERDKAVWGELKKLR